jgi:uncharacterized Zn finger protein
MSWYGYGFRPYVSVAQRRANAAREMAKLAKKGHTVTPVQIEGRKIANTFWGKAWCDNLESYSDFANRMPRGRTYVRNGSVVDLQIKPGRVTARVSGSSLYDIDIKIKPLSKPHWQSISSQCAGKIASVLELLQGRLSRGVMEIITHREQGLFPKPSEISLDCSCPDWADMCKHVAAALYGVGARLDEKPELLFVLRQVDHMELIEQAAAGQSLAPAAGSGKKTIAEGDLAEVFGIEMDTVVPASAAQSSAQGAVAETGADKTAKTRPGRQAAGGRGKKSAKSPASARRGVRPGESAGGKAKRGASVSQAAARPLRKRPKAK